MDEVFSVGGEIEDPELNKRTGAELDVPAGTSTLLRERRALMRERLRGT
jgi:hypothetical protein